MKFTSDKPMPTSSGSADSHAIEYRADIDGLRAIAVLSVIVFHLSRQLLAGGYLGVDMFFVLSGYLITGIIWREAQEARFTILGFYDRRIRRIMPALLLLLVCTTAASALLLLPADMIGYSKSLLATLVFSANIYFFRDTNYFSPAAELKPLLHIWSLGVEEQFYILFPFILILLARWSARRALTAVTALTMVSLAADLIAGFLGASVAAFFLLPARAWELGIGAALALLPAGTGPRSITAQICAALGVLLVGFGLIRPVEAYWFFPAPMPVVIGTALLVFAGQRERPLISRALRFRPIVFVGLISYSLYLWHWPWIVFGQYYLVRAFTPAEMGAVSLSMAACAIASWWFVERPFRSRKIPTMTVRIAAGIGVVALATAAGALLWGRGLPWRLGAAASLINQAVDTNFHCPLQDYLGPFGGSRACVLNLPSHEPADADAVLLGNSHAQMYAPVWRSILTERGETGILVPVNGCLPTVQVNISHECIDIAQANLKAVSGLTRAHTIIVGLNWQHGKDDLVGSDGRTIDNSGGRAIVAGLDDLIDRLHGAGKQVVLIGPIAEPGWSVASILGRQLAFGHRIDRPTFLPTSEFEQRFGPAIQHFEARDDIGFARPDKVQCPADRCYYVIEGHSLFADATHIAVAELPRFRAIFTAAMPPLLPNTP